MISASVISYVLHEVHSLPGPLVYALVALLVFGEAALFVGFVLPGETTVIVAGVVASQGNINIGVLCALVVVSAVLGDTVGYAVGHHFGDRLLEIRVLQRHREELDDALAGLRRRGPLYVFVGISKMHYRRFLLANALGGLVWGIAFSLLGYFSGSQLARVEKYSSWLSIGLVIIVVLAITLFEVRRRRRRRRKSERTET